MQLRRCLGIAILIGASTAAVTIGYAAQNGQTQRPAQSPGSAPGATVETAGQSKQFKNIQVLKDIPADQLVPSMEFISQSLGVDCSFCHLADKHDFAADDKSNKKTAREMMTMTMGINQNSFAGQQRVTCATCHQGHNQPNPVAPVLDAARWQERVDAEARQAARAQASNTPAQGAGAAPGGQAQAAGGRPTPQAMQAAAEEIINKYVEAIGGEAAIQKLNSREEKGTITTPHGDAVQYELQQKAPDRILFVRTPANGQGMKIVYNGTTAVANAGGKANPIEGFELGALKLDANFFRNMNLKQQYTRVQSPPFPQKIDGREVKVVRGLLPNSQGQETLYFDAQSGLLVRRTTELRTALGRIPRQYDYSDYRDVNGVKIPFTIKTSTAENIQTRQITEARFNVPLDDSSFAVPATGGQ